MLRRELLMGLLACMPAKALLAQSWPQFRGPGARGVAAHDPLLPETWSNRENVVWRREVPGRGWSSPVVWNDLIFVQSNVNSDGDAAPERGFFGGSQQYSAPNQEHRWIVHAIDFADGRTRWTRELHRAVPKGARHPKNSYVSETAVTDGTRLYVHIGDLGTYCLDVAGSVLWSKEWPVFETRYGYGTGSSPALHDGRLFILNDNESRSYLVALDAATGRQIWKVDRDEPTTWSTPYVWRNERRTEIVTAGTNKVRSYDLDGALLWEISGMSSLSIPTPFSADGLLFVTSGYRGDQHRPVYAVRPGASGDITLAKDQTSNAFIAWSLRQGGPYVTSPLVYEGRYYTLLDQGFLTCHDAQTGRELYGRQRIDPASGNFTSSPWAYNGRIFCLSEEGVTFVIQAGPQFRVLGRNEIDDFCMASPAIVRSSVILRTFSSLYRIGRST
jgi:outer membrane protein assembly factor BamB